MPTPVAVTTLLKGTIISLDDEIGIIESGAVVVDGDTILAVGTAADIATRYTATKVADVPDAIIMPGMIDGHTHTAQSLVRGLIANELPMIFRLYVPAMQALDVRGAGLSAKLAAAQLLRSGVTTICEGAVGYSPEA
jgi:5-methylthioadenosine/S-adenosylhomocysteine deaminase